MSKPSVDVWDPSAEGPWIVDSLRQEGFDVRAVALADVPLTRADLVLMAGDVDGALAALKLLRDDGVEGDVPVILLGLPPGSAGEAPEGPAFGADAVLARPIDFEPLLARVASLMERPGPEVSRVGVAPVERTMQLSDPEDLDSSQVMVRASDAPDPAPSWRPREPTMQLEGPSQVTSPSRVRATLDESLPGVDGEGRSRDLMEESGEVASESHAALDAPQPEIPVGQRAQLSPWLEELLEAADRRVFPDREPLALHFPAASQSAEELVPQELFEAGTFRIDEPVIEDPIDAFTFVGGPAVPPPVHSSAGVVEAETTSARAQTSAETPRRIEQTTATETPPRVEEEETPGSGVHPATVHPPEPPHPGGEWPRDDSVLGRAEGSDRTRTGVLGAGGVLRLLWRVTALRLDGLCELDLPDGLQVRMTFLSGQLRAIDGPVARRVLADLRRRGRATESPPDERGAEAVLQRKVDGGEIGRFERDRLLREAREALLESLIAAPRAEFVLRRLDDTQPGRALARSRVFARPLRSQLVEAARRALDADDVVAWIGEGRGLALGPERDAALVAAELPSELVELILRLEGHPLTDFLAAAPTERGLAGLLYALVAGDALVLEDAPASPPASGSRAPVRALHEAAAALAEDGDYFSVLGLSRDASGAEVDRAHASRRDELSALPLETLGLEGFEAKRREALDAVDEARRVLSDARRRAAYASALP
ncbi:MAG: hypothetical protein RID93_28235 [Sandaracinaceae bacterium]